MSETDNNNLPLEKADARTCVNCDASMCDQCHCRRSHLYATNWLDDVPGNDFDLVEVHFKNTRRGFYRNSAHLDLAVGDWVAVESNPGHDIGQVAMTGQLVKLQMRRANLRPGTEFLRIFRKAKQQDMERFEQAKAREIDTMIRSRKIAVDLGLKMKIGDVEYQGDGNKAIFYYIADERVDFRQLIKVLAEVFRIRVEMKQIGARQEAGRIGGIGPCGRPLCCASWITNFVSVATNAARYQDVSLNPQKLAGQCAKLKCCINFEVDTYVEATRKLPPRDVTLHTQDTTYYYFKADAIKQEITYSTQKNSPEGLVTLTAEQANEVIAMNREGLRPEKLTTIDSARDAEVSAFGDILGQDAINRFDKKKRKRKRGDSKADGKEAARPADKSGKEARPDREPKMNRGNRPEKGNRPDRPMGAPKPQRDGKPTPDPRPDMRARRPQQGDPRFRRPRQGLNEKNAQRQSRGHRGGNDNA